MPSSPTVQRRLGQAVKAVRTTQALTQEEVARRAGMHPTYISDIERGARNPSFEALTRLAKGLGVPVSTIAEEYDRRARRR
jgi:transcriptional regulator with XRE-family HTH domain